MTSGAASTSSSYGGASPSSVRITGVSSPSSSSSSATHGSTPSSFAPYACCAIATGTTPSASTASVLPQPHVATRSGAAVISVSPKACSMVTGKSPSDAASGPGSSVAGAEQPARARAAAAAAAMTAIVRRACMNSLSWSGVIEVSLT